MSNNNIIRELKLHSPAGVEPAIFTWPYVDNQVKLKKKNYLNKYANLHLEK